eukprot:TRINITY_DN11763_c0_g1_i2.p1 TRINITY_DN11763_c0_g1~~TRINITY_DN11763_c0_g1_i2.p1  ORF type:complete len:306 (+),score=48.15 TRINITY_DN11763_c0_g1_i2:125-1042(+)
MNSLMRMSSPGGPSSMNRCPSAQHQRWGTASDSSFSGSDGRRFCHRRLCTASAGQYLLVAALAAAAGWYCALAVHPGSSCERGPRQQFRGVQPRWRTQQTLAVRELASTRFARCEVHTVRTERGSTINDWLWFEEADAVNVLVHRVAPGGGDEFVVFRQRKYGIPRPALAVLGGIIEPGETPLAAARRELREELQMEAEEFMPLGSYRVAANRGGGTINCFAALRCMPARNRSGGHDDLERQERLVLSSSELRRRLLAGELGEIKWAATAALALLRLEGPAQPPSPPQLAAAHRADAAGKAAARS